MRFGWLKTNTGLPATQVGNQPQCVISHVTQNSGSITESGMIPEAVQQCVICEYIRNLKYNVHFCKCNCFHGDLQVIPVINVHLEIK